MKKGGKTSGLFAQYLFQQGVTIDLVTFQRYMATHLADLEKRNMIVSVKRGPGFSLVHVPLLPTDYTTHTRRSQKSRLSGRSLWSVKLPRPEVVVAIVRTLPNPFRPTLNDHHAPSLARGATSQARRGQRNEFNPCRQVGEGGGRAD